MTEPRRFAPGGAVFAAHTLRGAVFAATITSFGCGGAASPPPQAPEPQECAPQNVAMTIVASPGVNPSDDGKARPVQVRVYQLKADARLLEASFESVWKADKTTFGDDLVKVDEFSVYPDTRTEATFERDPAAKFVAAIALFRNPLGRSWWTDYELGSQPPKGQCLPAIVKFPVWVDAARIVDGSDHVDDKPAGGTHQTQLRFDSTGTQDSKGAP